MKFLDNDDYDDDVDDDYDGDGDGDGECDGDCDGDGYDDGDDDGDDVDDGRRPMAIQSRLDLALSLLIQSIRGCLAQFPNTIQIPMFSPIQILISNEIQILMFNLIQIPISKYNRNTSVLTNIYVNKSKRAQ